MSNATTERSPGQAASIFAALGDETRLTLVARLATSGPLSISRLTEGTGITRQAVTRHLFVLEEAGLVRGKKSGRERLWEVERTRLEEARAWLAVISAQWDDALGRLKAFVEEG
jgi:DNA-binding transcriptional ArsR family regulator